MRLLLDQNISYRAAKKLNEAFPECKHVSDCGLMNTEDLHIWSYAQRNSYTIVTFDADFYDISLINGHPPKIIWLRTGNLTKNDLARLLINRKYKILEFIRGQDFGGVLCLEVE